MAEYIRSVAVHIEVDTNKQTYTLDLPDAEFSDVEGAVHEFLEGVLA